MGFDMRDCSFTGRLGADPVGADNKSGNGRNVRIRVAVATGKDRDSGKELTTWINATAFGAQGKVLEDYAKKGDKIGISGRFALREYTKQDGGGGTSFDVEVTSVTLLTAKGEGSGPASSGASAQPAWDNGALPF